MEHWQELGVEGAPLPLQPGSSPALPFGWWRFAPIRIDGTRAAASHWWPQGLLCDYGRWDKRILDPLVRESKTAWRRE